MTKLQQIIRRQRAYISSSGGYRALRESDETYNDMNREMIAAFLAEHGKAYLGNINFYLDERQAVIDGDKSVYEEYTCQMVYNFACDFCVPCADEQLEELIRRWNLPENSSNRLNDIGIIMNRIEKLHGLDFIWF